VRKHVALAGHNIILSVSIQLTGSQARGFVPENRGALSLLFDPNYMSGSGRLSMKKAIY
jgi:hypothetical protein